MLALVLTGIMAMQALIAGADPELVALETEIAQLEAARSQAGGFANNKKRDEIDRELAKLRRVYAKASVVSNNRVQRCFNAHVSTPAPQQGQALPPAQQQTALCIAAANGVVGQVRRAEEIRDLLRYGNWTYSNFEQKQALQKELNALDQTLR